jgi:hypothetical protein
MTTNQEVVNALNEPTPKDRVQFRVGFKNRSGTKACMLAYVDARFVMDRLDYAVGKDNWSGSYNFTGNKMFCTIKVTWPDGKVTKKTDCGIETEVDAEKGQASDAFKRAAVHYGIGRDLYSMGKYWADLDNGYVDRDWQPKGWGSSTEASTTTHTSASKPQPDPSVKKEEEKQDTAMDIADRIAEKAQEQHKEAENDPFIDEIEESDSETKLKKGTPPEDEFVWINDLKKGKETEKAILFLPPTFTGDPNDYDATKNYWIPKQYVADIVDLMNGKCNVHVARWIASQTLPNGEPKYKVEDTPF